MNNETLISRRTLLAWSTPAVFAVSLPAHASMSPCIAAGIVATGVQPKCSGINPIFGEATVEFLSDNASVDIEILTIEVSGNSADDTVTIPTLPATASTTNAVMIDWTGPSTDGETCLPVSTITLTVGFSCGGSVVPITQVFSLTEILAATI